MAFKKKTSADTKHLNDFMSSDVRSGNNSFDQGVQVINWPYQGFTTDNELDPKLNQFPAPQLSGNPQAFKDDGATPRAVSTVAPRSTLG